MFLGGGQGRKVIANSGKGVKAEKSPQNLKVTRKIKE